jgi:cytochrome c-type biogenesis protein CcmH
MRHLIALFLAFAFFTATASAVEPDEVLKDPVLEARARALSAELRCLVCQNQSIDDSDAGLAKDLRILLRERLVAGDSDEQAVNYLVNRFGEYVLLKPRFASHTLLLWTGPFILLAIGMFVLLRLRSRRPATTAENALTAQEKQQMKELLDDAKD